MIRVMSWNIRTGFGNDPTTGERVPHPDLDRIAAVINRVHPDIVALQEVDRGRERTGGVDQTSVIASMTGMDGVFAPNVVGDDGHYGTSILSRLRVESCEHTRFPIVDTWEPRGLLDVVVDARGRGVRVLNTHLQVGFDGTDDVAALQRADAAEMIALRARAAGEPLVLMGDFNADPGAPELEALHVLTDAWAEQDDAGFTFPALPAGKARERIDAIFVSKQWLVRDIAVLDTPDTRLASDHYPLVADLVLVEQPG
jgi:endonuclease/exonuclease/phosphatase family metal-dependent hydrolase